MDQYISTRGDTDFQLMEVIFNQILNNNHVFNFINITANEILALSNVFIAKRRSNNETYYG